MSALTTQFPAAGAHMRWRIAGQAPVAGKAVHSWQHASACWGEALQLAGHPGASDVAQTPEVLDAEGAVIAHVSYNGRVWPGTERDWRPGAVPLYDPCIDVQTARADAAYAAYDFGDDVVVEDHVGWEYTSPGTEWSRAVYVRTDDEAEATARLTFTVRFDDVARVVEAYAIDSKGQIWGAMPCPKAESSSTDEPEGMRP